MNIIYLYREKSTKKVKYVGITCNINQRRKQHEKDEAYNNLRAEYNYPLSRAIRKYGAEAFEFEIIEEIESREEANIREDYWIEFYDTIKNGYNQIRGGNNRTKFSEEEINEIKEQIKLGCPYQEISEKFDCSIGWLSQINNGEAHFDNKEKYPLCPKKMGKRLSNEDVIEIITLLSRKEKKVKDIAKLYDVSSNVIVRINQGTAYKQEGVQYPIRKGRVR